MKFSLIFGRIWIGSGDQCNYGHFGDGLDIMLMKGVSKVSVDSRFNNI